MECIFTVDHHYSKSDIEDLLNLGIESFRINPSRIGEEKAMRLWEDLKCFRGKQNIFIDTNGNKARVQLNDTFIFLGDIATISTVSHKDIDIQVPSFFYNRLKQGDEISIKDVKLTVTSVADDRVFAVVRSHDHSISNHAPIVYSNYYFPYTHLGAEDSRLIENFQDKGIMAVSFTDKSSLMNEITEKWPNVSAFAKIETPFGIREAKQIIRQCQGIIVGRDDLSRFYSVKEIDLIVTYLARLCAEEQKECIPASNYFLTLLKDQNLKSDISANLQNLRDMGVKRIYCNESVICKDFGYIVRIVDLCRKL